MKIRRQWNSQQFSEWRLFSRGQKVTKGELIPVPWQNHDRWGNSTENNIMIWPSGCWYSGAWMIENLQHTDQTLALQLTCSFHLYTQMWVLEIHQRYKQDILMLWKADALGKQTDPLRIKWNEFVRSTGIPQDFDNFLSPAGCIFAMWNTWSQCVSTAGGTVSSRRNIWKELAEKIEIQTQSTGEKIGE